MMDERLTAAIRRELLERRRFKEALGAPRSLTVIGTRHPRLNGDNSAGEHISILVKYTGDLRARSYAYWMTASPSEIAAAADPPKGFRYWIAQVGLLPNRDPWWIALYDLQAVLEADLENPGLIERVDMPSGKFYRVNPANLPADLRPIMLDVQTVTMDQLLEEQTGVEQEVAVAATEADDINDGIDERIGLRASLAGYRPGERVTLRGTVVKHNKGTTNVLLDGMPGSDGWAVVNSAIPADVE